MTLNKKLLAGAIVGVLFSANASAVVLGTDPARVYAAEMSAPVDLSADTSDTVDFETGYNFSPGEVRYGRFECTTNMTMDNAAVTENDGTIDLGSINGQGTPALFFSMTANTSAADTDLITVDADNTLLDGGDVTCSFSIYDQPSQAQAGGITGRIYSTGFKPFISRASGFVFEMDPNGVSQAVADVEDPAGAYFGFVGGGNPKTFGNVVFQPVAGVLNATGSAIALADIFDPDSTVTVEGDLSAATGIGDDATFTIAPVDGNVATFDAFDTAGFGTLYYFQTGADPIKESEYTATLHAVANTDYTVADAGPIHVGSIVRNGTQLQAPLAQVPGDGWLSRMVLTNNGGVDRTYEISVMGEAGNTIGTSNTTGTVPAHGTVVVDLNTVLTSFSAGQKPRATLNVMVAAPDGQIQGLYQIVNAASGAISNHVMVRPGTN